MAPHLLEPCLAALAAAPGALPYYWHLPVLILVISLVYSATRFDEWPVILREGLRWGLRVLGFLGGIAAVLYLLALVI